MTAPRIAGGVLGLVAVLAVLAVISSEFLPEGASASIGYHPEPTGPAR
jgi:hypothetical protein